MSNQSTGFKVGDRVTFADERGTRRESVVTRIVPKGEYSRTEVSYAIRGTHGDYVRVASEIELVTEGGQGKVDGRCVDCSAQVSVFPDGTVTVDYVQLCPRHKSTSQLYAACDAIVRWDEAEKTALPYDDDGGKAFHERVRLCDEAMTLARSALASARGGEKNV